MMAWMARMIEGRLHRHFTHVGNRGGCRTGVVGALVERLGGENRRAREASLGGTTVHELAVRYRTGCFRIGRGGGPRSLRVRVARRCRAAKPGVAPEPEIGGGSVAICIGGGI